MFSIFRALDKFAYKRMISYVKYICLSIGLVTGICACAKPLYLSDFDTGEQVLSIHGNVSVEMPEGSSLSAQAKLRLRKDSIIWGIFSVFGVEGLRIRVTKDKVEAQMRFPKKSSYTLSYQELQDFTGVAMQYLWFENILLARPLFPIKNYTLSKKANKKKYYTYQVNDTLRVSCTLLSNRLINQSLHQRTTSQVLVNYTYEEGSSSPLPKYIRLESTDTQRSQQVVMELKYKQTQFIEAERAQFPFKSFK